MNKVASQTQGQTKANLLPASGILQRKCACGNHTPAGGECDECRTHRSELQRTKSSPFIDQQAMQSSVDSLTRGLMGSRFGFDFSRVRVHGEQGTATLQEPGTDAKQPTQRESQAQGMARLSSNEAQLDVDVKVVRPSASSRLAAALSTAGEEIEEDGEDILTAQTPPGPVTPVPMSPPAPSCSFAITYQNVRNTNCEGGRCGAQIVYDITGVTATGTGCPASLDGLRLTESVTNDHGCSPANVQGGAGCSIAEHPPLLPGHGIIQNCTDTYGVCLGSTSTAKIPAAGCTETVTQQLFVGGVLAETHLIRFRITRAGGGCTGTVTRT